MSVDFVTATLFHRIPGLHLLLLDDQDRACTLSAGSPACCLYGGILHGFEYKPFWMATTKSAMQIALQGACTFRHASQIL